MMATMTRRDFARGAAGLFGWGLFAGTFGGCGHFDKNAAPNLTLGVISDIHIRLERKDGKDSFGGVDRFRKALAWFRDQGVDGVTISGDLADHGLVEELVEVGRVWQEVFPGDKAPDGRRVERLFVYGNHDWEGYKYGKTAEKFFGKDYAGHTIHADLAGAWKKAFGEEYADVWRKEVKGYSFIGAHWIADRCRGAEEIGVPQTPAWFEKNGQTLDPSKPFFYLQHPPAKNTCHGAWLWGHEDGRLTATLSKYPNAIAITGHSHASLTSDRALWQGAFTALDAGSIFFTGHEWGDLKPAWRENDNNNGDAAKENSRKIMQCIPTDDGYHVTLARVYDDRITFERYDFETMDKLGADWIVPLPVKDPAPFAFEPRAAVSAAPQFPVGAALAVRMTTGKNRGGWGGEPSKERRVLEVVIPPANRAGAGRVIDYAVEIAGKEGGKDMKYVFAEGFHRCALSARAKQPTVFQIDADLLTAKGAYEIKVYPRNCFGVAGKALVESAGAGAAL